MWVLGGGGRDAGDLWDFEGLILIYFGVYGSQNLYLYPYLYPISISISMLCVCYVYVMDVMGICVYVYVYTIIKHGYLTFDLAYR